MNNIEMMLNIFRVKFNEIFEVIDSNKQSIGMYTLVQTTSNNFVLKYYNSKSNRWIIKNNELLGLMLLSIIKGENTVKQFDASVVEESKPIRYRRAKRCKEYPIYSRASKIQRTF